MLRPLEEAKTCQEQTEKLVDFRCLEVPDRSRAEDILSAVNYYGPSNLVPQIPGSEAWLYGLPSGLADAVTGNMSSKSIHHGEKNHGRK